MTMWFHHGKPASGMPLDDRATQYGDGLFETVAVRQGVLRFWQAHVERLTAGCMRLSINPPDPERLNNQVLDALQASGIDSACALVKIIVSAGRGRRGYERTGGAETEVYIGVFESAPRDAACYTEGVSVVTCVSRLAIQPATAGIKTLNRIEQVLARNEWQDKSVREGLMLDTEGRLICGTMSNVFVIKNQAIATPELLRCGVAGVMRRKVMDIVADAELTCTVRDLSADEIAGADEVFLTNSQFGIWPIRSIDGQVLGVGPVTRRVMEAAASQVTECAR